MLLHVVGTSLTLFYREDFPWPRNLENSPPPAGATPPLAADGLAMLPDPRMSNLLETPSVISSTLSWEEEPSKFILCWDEEAAMGVLIPLEYAFPFAFTFPEVDLFPRMPPCIGAPPRTVLRPFGAGDESCSFAASIRCWWSTRNIYTTNKHIKQNAKFIFQVNGKPLCVLQLNF